MVLGEGGQPPPHQLVGLGERCKLPQQGPGRSPGRRSGFLHFIDTRWLFLAFQMLLAKQKKPHQMEYARCVIFHSAKDLLSTFRGCEPVNTLKYGPVCALLFLDKKIKRDHSKSFKCDRDNSNIVQARKTHHPIGLHVLLLLNLLVLPSIRSILREKLDLT